MLPTMAGSPTRTDREQLPIAHGGLQRKQGMPDNDSTMFSLGRIARGASKCRMVASSYRINRVGVTKAMTQAVLVFLLGGYCQVGPCVPGVSPCSHQPHATGWGGKKLGRL